MATNDLLLPKRETWKSLNIEDLIVQDQTIVEDLMVEGDLELKSGNYTSALETATLTNNRTITFPDKTGTVVVDTDLSLMVTETSTNTSGNVMIGGGSRLIQDSNIALTQLPKVSTVSSMSGSYSGQPTFICGHFTSATTPIWVGTKGLTSIVKNSTGVYTITYSTAFTNIPSVVVTNYDTNTSFCGLNNVSVSSTTGCVIRIFDRAGGVFDFMKYNIMICGV